VGLAVSGRGGGADQEKIGYGGKDERWAGIKPQDPNALRGQFSASKLEPLSQRTNDRGKSERKGAEDAEGGRKHGSGRANTEADMNLVFFYVGTHVEASAKILRLKP